MKVTFKDDRLPEGTEVYVKGVGVLVNGKTVEVDCNPKLFENDPRIRVAKGGDS